MALEPEHKLMMAVKNYPSVVLKSDAPPADESL